MRVPLYHSNDEQQQGCCGTVLTNGLAFVLVPVCAAATRACTAAFTHIRLLLYYSSRTCTDACTYKHGWYTALTAAYVFVILVLLLYISLYKQPSVRTGVHGCYKYLSLKLNLYNTTVSSVIAGSCTSR